MLTENQLTFKNDINFDDLLEKYLSQEEFVVKVIKFDMIENLVECYISQNLLGYIPIQEFNFDVKSCVSKMSHYMYYPEIAQRIGKNILVCVDHNPQLNQKIFLSRKKCIRKNYDLLKRRDVIKCEITCIASNALYLDCGGGVQGRVDISEAIIPFVRDLRDSGFEKGEIIPCEIIGFDDATCKLTLSFQKACNITYSCGDMITGKIREKLQDNEFSTSDTADFFVEILPTHKAGILNSKLSDKLQYNDNVSCIVSAVKSADKYKLRFISKL